MKRLVCLPAIALLAAGCATPLTPRERGAVTGAAIGAGIGAVAGSASGHAGAGAVIGGVSGAVVGGVIGDAAQQRQAAAPPPAPAPPPVPPAVVTRPPVAVPPPPVVVAPPVVVVPPSVVVAARPTWILIPGTAVYYSPEIQADVYLHGGIWYYRVNGVWFTGSSYSGPWEATPVTAVPVVVTRVPPGWRPKHGPPAIPPGHRKKMGG